eukprot:UN1088
MLNSLQACLLLCKHRPRSMASVNRLEGVRQCRCPGDSRSAWLSQNKLEGVMAEERGRGAHLSRNPVINMRWVVRSDRLQCRQGVNSQSKKLRSQRCQEVVAPPAGIGHDDSGPCSKCLGGAPPKRSRFSGPIEHVREDDVVKASRQPSGTL